jgi:hypothetical protein
MNRKQLTLVIVLGVVLGALGFYVKNRNTSSWKSTGGGLGDKLLGEFDVNAVAQITVKQATNELNLVKSEDVWRVKERWDYPANFENIQEFLRKAWEMKTVRKDPIGASQLPRMELVEPGKGDKSGTLIELKDKDGKLIKSMILGKKHMRGGGDDDSPMGGGGWPDGRYVLVASNPGTVALISEVWSNLEPKPDQWLNKDFFKCEKIKSVSLNWTNAWTLTRETEGGELKLADLKPGEDIDSTKTSSIGNVFGWPSFEDIAAPDAKPEDLGLDKPITAKIETFDKFTYEFKIGNKPVEEDYFMTVAVSADIPKERTPGTDEKPEDKERLDKEFKEKNDKLQEKLDKEKPLAKWTYRVSKWTVDSLLKDRPQLMKEKKADEKKDGDKADEKETSDLGPVKADEDEKDDDLLKLDDK